MLIFINTLTTLAQNCNIQNWDNQQIYTSGNQVKYNGTIYEAKWWIQGSAPTSDPYGPWHFVELCTTEIIDPSTCESIDLWNNTQVYNGGETVRFNGTKYQSNYYSVNANPESNYGENASVGKPWILLGDCDIPNITKVGTLSDFTTEVGERSTIQSLTVAAANLTTVLNITVPANFEIALSENGPWKNSISLSPTTGGVLPTEIYVAYNPNGLGYHHGTVVFTSTSATPVEFEIKGTAEKFTHVVCNSKEAWESGSIYNTGDLVTYNGKLYRANWWTQGQTPDETQQYGPWSVKSECVFTELTINTANLQPFTTLLGTPSATQTLALQLTDIYNLVDVELPNHFEISLTQNGTYTNRLTLEPTNNEINVSLFVRYNPSSAGNHAGKILISTAGLAPTAVDVQGSSTPLWSQTANDKAELNLSIKQVGIGTSTVPSSYMMAVNGKILARGLKIQADGWADFVFQEDYKLIPLEEVETYIATEKHLPNIPTEEEIKANGIDTEEMLTLHMQKIEELTLYLIELKKQNQALENRIKTLESNE